MSEDLAKNIVDLLPYEYQEYPFASYIEGRTNGSGWDGRGGFKRHKTLAHAKSAVNNYNTAYGQRGKIVTKRLYKWVGEITPGPDYKKHGYWELIEND